MRIFLDPGHGNFSGARGYENKFDEDKIVLAVALKMGKLAERARHVVGYSRTRNDIKPTLEERGMMATVFKPDVAISIHCDSILGKPEVGDQRGYYLFGDKPSGELATNIVDNCPPMVRRKLGEQIVHPCRQGNKPSDFRRAWAVLHHHQGRGYPAVLIETGFISNPNVGAWLSSATGQTAIAQRILVGIHRHFGIEPELILEG